MFKNLMPKEKFFFELFGQMADTIQKALDLFGELIKDYDQREKLFVQIKEAESEADLIAHKVLNLVTNTFVTPFDREDIQLLVHGMDDVIDLVEATSARMELYDLPAPPDEVREMNRVLGVAFGLIAKVIGKLDNLKKNREDILNICVQVNSLENEGDSLLRLALRRLFREPTDPLHVIKMKEIYENMERAIDRCEDLADIIETILAKNA